MSRIRKGLIIFLYVIISGNSYSQISPSFTQFFINPYHFNPSYAGIEGRPALYLTHRQQWMGIEGAPMTTSLSFHTPLVLGLTMGTDIYHDTRSLLNTNSFMLTIGYVASFTKRTFLRFGISGGVGFRNIDLSQVDNPSDPALLNALDNNLYLNGNFGISFQTGYFSFGLALPNLFEPNLNNTEIFQNGTLTPYNEIIANASYRFYFALDDMAFEPHILYRYSYTGVEPQQWEAAGILHVKHILWFGGSYRQDYGVSGLIGLKFNNKLLIGYSYGVGLESLPGIGRSSHEFNLSLLMGREKRSRKKTQRLDLSFINTKRVYASPEEEIQIASNQKTDKPVIVFTHQGDSSSSHDAPRMYMQNLAGSKNVFEIRAETVVAGNSDFELTRGYYIIAEDFEEENSAMEYSDKLNDQGYRAGYGYVTRLKRWAVYVYRSDSRLGLRKQALKIKQSPDFSDPWMLNVD